MKRIFGTLYYAFAVFLNAIELSSQASLRELFHECEGDDLPAVQIIKYEANPKFIKLRRIVKDDVMECYESSTTLAVRSHIVVGWMDGTTIRAITSESHQLNVVFDINANDFVPLDYADLKRLGIDRRLHTIRKYEEAAEMRRARQQANFRETQQTIHLLDHVVFRQAYDQLNHPAVHQAHEQLNQLEISQAYNQLNHHTVYQATQEEHLRASHEALYQTNPLTFHEPIPQAHDQFNHQALHNEYYEEMQHTNLHASQGVNHQLNHPPGQVNPELNMQANIQASRTDRSFSKRQRHN